MPYRLSTNPAVTEQLVAMTRTRAVKRRIEAEYDHDRRPVDTGADHVGQMTIASCASDVCSGEWDCLPPQ